MKGTGGISMQQSEQTKVVLHLGQAIDAQSKGKETQAAEEMEAALEANFKHPALYFNLGCCASKANDLKAHNAFYRMPSNIMITVLALAPIGTNACQESRFSQRLTGIPRSVKTSPMQ
jgi:hypothetical protein